VTVGGSIVRFTASDFVATAPYTKSALVSTASADKSMPTTTALYDGTLPFHLPKVPAGLAWVHTQQVATDILGTWFLVNADGMTDVQLPVVDLAVFSALAGQLPAPVTLSDTSAHLVVFAVDAQNKPLSGVTVTPALGGVVGCDDGQGYTGSVTHARGACVILNATTTKTTTLVLSTTTIPATTVPDVPLDAATVTLVKVTLTPPLPRSSGRWRADGMHPPWETRWTERRSPSKCEPRWQPRSPRSRARTAAPPGSPWCSSATTPRRWSTRATRRSRRARSAFAAT
jgi:hypothetical protein